MTITSNDNRRAYEGNGMTVAFAFPPPFTAAADLLVMTRDAAGSETTLALGTDYAVAGAGEPSGGTVTLTAPLPAGRTLHIIRDVSPTQPLILLDGGPLPAETANDAFDRRAMVEQRLAERLDRALVLRETDTIGAEGEFPVRGNRLTGLGAGTGPSDAATISQIQTIVAESGNVPAPVPNDLGKRLTATASGVFQWRTVPLVSIQDFNGADDNATNNTPSITAAKTRYPIGLSLRLPYLSDGVYKATTTPNLTGFVIDADPGVRIEGPLQTPVGVHVLRPLELRYTGAAAYSYIVSPSDFAVPGEKEDFLGHGDIRRRTLSIPGTSLFSLSRRTWPTDDTYMLDGATAVSPGTVQWTMADDGQVRYAALASIPGDRLTWCWTALPANSLGVVLPCTNGVVTFNVTGDGNAGVLSMKPVGGSRIDVTVPQWLGRSTHQSWLPRVCRWTVQIEGPYQFAILFNGAMVCRRNLVADGVGWITDVGPAVFGNAASVGNSIVARSIVKERSHHLTAPSVRYVLVAGDSKTTPTWAGVWTTTFRRVLEGSFGLRVDRLSNLAVGGHTSGQQLADLETWKAANPSEWDRITDFIIHVGTNDAQQLISSSTTYNNIASMITTAQTAGKTVTLISFDQWYSSGLAGGGGQNTANYAAAAQWRSVIIQLAAAYKTGLVDAEEILGVEIADWKTAGGLTGSNGGTYPRIFDNIHPSAAGAKQLGWHIAGAVAGLIVPDRTPTSSGLALTHLALPTFAAAGHANITDGYGVVLTGKVSKGANIVNTDTIMQLPRSLCPATDQSAPVTIAGNALGSITIYGAGADLGKVKYFGTNTTAVNLTSLSWFLDQ